MEESSTYQHILHLGEQRGLKMGAVTLASVGVTAVVEGSS